MSRGHYATWDDAAHIRQLETLLKDDETSHDLVF